jgi:hypothetical protein
MIRLRMAGLALLLAGTAPVHAQAPLPPTFTPSKTPLTTAVAPIPGASTGGVTDPAAHYLAPGVQPDLAFGAFQRGYYLTALQQAIKRIEADANDAPAMALMGELYRDGLGLRRNLAEATRWYRLAADRGDPPAAFALALAYLQGQGVEQDVAAAIPWLELAAAAGHPGAFYNLGLMAAQADTPDFAKAAGLFRRAADLGNSEAAYALGLQYLQGRGLARDGGRAAEECAGLPALRLLRPPRPGLPPRPPERPAPARGSSRPRRAPPGWCPRGRARGAAPRGRPPTLRG